MADVKIKTPDGNLPSSPNPVEGKDYTVVVGPLQEGDMCLAGGKVFCIYHAPIIPGPPDPPPLPQPTVADLSAAVTALALDVKAIKAKVGA